jgi:hypothetical protein
VISAMLYDAVSDGKHILYGMLITALIFLAVIGLGELSKWAGHRRQARKRSARTY